MYDIPMKMNEVYSSFLASPSTNFPIPPRQCRLVAYRVFLEWVLQGEKLGPGERQVLPSCVVTAIRKKYPSTSGVYSGFQEAEDASRII